MRVYQLSGALREHGSIQYEDIIIFSPYLTEWSAGRRTSLEPKAAMPASTVLISSWRQPLRERDHLRCGACASLDQAAA